MLRFGASPYREVETKLGYRFRSRSILEAALTHRSYRFENDGVTQDNQRLEFLGDAVLGFLSAAFVYDKHAEHDEGILTSFRSQTTSGKALAELARKLNLGTHLRMGKGEENSGGRDRSSNLADALESLLGAAYVDGGIRAARRIFEKICVPELNALSGDVWAGNPKGELQEISQRRWKASPQYVMIRKEGPAHETVFTVEVRLEGGLTARGRGRNKQCAEVQAAMHALKRMGRGKRR